MSTDYKLEKKITMEELFDGRLEPYGAREHKEERSSSEFRVLTDGISQLAVYAEGVVRLTKRCGTNNEILILNAIAEAFDTKIYSEHAPQFWGYDTNEEWEASERYYSENRESFFYAKLMKIIRNGEADSRETASTLDKVAIAKDLIADDPNLGSPDRMYELLEAIDKRYKPEPSESGVEALRRLIRNRIDIDALLQEK